MAVKTVPYGSDEAKKDKTLVPHSKRRGEPFQKHKPVTNQDTIQKERTDRCSKIFREYFHRHGKKMTHLACARGMLSKSVC